MSLVTCALSKISVWFNLVGRCTLFCIALFPFLEQIWNGRITPSSKRICFFYAPLTASAVKSCKPKYRNSNMKTSQISLAGRPPWLCICHCHTNTMISHPGFGANYPSHYFHLDQAYMSAARRNQHFWPRMRLLEVIGGNRRIHLRCTVVLCAIFWWGSAAHRCWRLITHC